MDESRDISFSRTAADLVLLGRDLYRRGWVLGTSGNFSVVHRRQPLELAITGSAVHKGQLAAEQILRVDENGIPQTGGRTADSQPGPSAETALHLAIVKATGAGAVVHTHSVAATILSERHAGQGGLSLKGYEMLKGLAGVGSHTHEERVPILENSQDYAALAGAVGEMLRQQPAVHGFLLQGHGLYTWGRDLKEAGRHVEILEFLFQVQMGGGEAWPS